MTDKDILLSDLNDISEILNNNGYGRWCATIRKAVALLKEPETTVKQWTKEIADYQLAHAPDSHDKGEKYQYKKGIWDGLQIAWNIISEGREVNEID